MRSIEGEPALVLRRTEYGESDLIVSLYCRSLGKVSALARSARKSRKRFGAGLGIFTLSEVSLQAKDKRELWTLLSAAPRRSYETLAVDLGCMAQASYGTELVRELTPAEQPEPDIFDLLAALFESLSQDGAKVGRLRVFELRLLAHLGLAPLFSSCVSCGSQDFDAGAILDPSRGGVLCRNCAPDARGFGVRTLDTETITYLTSAQECPRLRDGDALEGSAVAVAARQAMLSLMYWHVGKPLKSVDFIAKLSAKR